MWALVHSTFETDVARGRELAQELLAAKELEERSEHDCIYLLSVALYRQGRLLDARRQLSELLKARTRRKLLCVFPAAGAPSLVADTLYLLACCCQERLFPLMIQHAVQRARASA